MDGATINPAEKRLLEYQGEDRIAPFSEIIQEFKERKEHKIILKSLFPSLDDLIDGFLPGELIIVSGPTGCGKTTLCRTLTYNFHKQNFPSLWFSYEEQPIEFLEKFPELPIAYMPKILAKNTLEWIHARVWEAQVKYGVKAVFIDHLHFLIDLAKLKNPSLEIGAIVRNLRRLAIKREIVLFLIAHLTKTKLEEEPDNEHLRDSSFLAQEASATMFIWRRAIKNTFTDEAFLKIAKHRRKGIMGKKIILKFFGNMFYEEIEPSQTSLWIPQNNLQN